MRTILPWISLNGRMIQPDSSLAGDIESGLQNKFGFFTTLKVREGIPLFWEHHIRRLKQSSGTLSVPLPVSFSDLHNHVRDVISKNNLTNGGIRITITADSMHPSSAPELLIHSFTYDSALQKISVITVPDPRKEFKTIKTNDRTAYTQSQEKARSQGAQDALFTQNNEGRRSLVPPILIESTNANILSFTPENTIITPPVKNKALNGITRQILMEAMKIRENNIPIDTNNPIILINSLNIRIINSIDGRKIKQDPEFVTLIRQALESSEKSYIENC